MLFSVNKFVKKTIKTEGAFFYRWIVFVYGLGIISGLLWGVKVSLMIATFLASCHYVFDWNKKIFLLLLSFSIGFAIGFHKNYEIDKIKMIYHKKMKNFEIKGIISSVKLTNENIVLIIKNIEPKMDKEGETKIRLICNDFEKCAKLNLKENVLINADLWYNRQNIFPHDLSYSNYAKYNKIVISGKVNEIDIVKDDSKKRQTFNMSLMIDKLRRNIQSKIYKSGGASSGSGVVIALLTGNTAFISKHYLEMVRRSGCAHILAISGLHMSIITAIFFTGFIRLLSFFPRIYLYYNTKKIAAIPTIFICLFYILISGAPISALRSFIMCSIVFLGIVFNRLNSSMSILMFSFVIITAFNPEQILSPSLQMSFIAVLSLVASYNSNLPNLIQIRNKYAKYLFGILFSSFSATFATAFYEVYHFKQYAWIGLVSNIFVIPLTEFITLPIGFLGMLFHFITPVSEMLYIVSSLVGEVICIVCEFFTQIPHSFVLTKQMPLWCIGLISLGLVLFFIMRSSIRYINLLLIFGTSFAYYKTKLPDKIVLNDREKSVILKTKDGAFCMPKEIRSNYVRSIAAQNLGIEKLEKVCDEKDLIDKKVAY